MRIYDILSDKFFFIITNSFLEKKNLSTNMNDTDLHITQYISICFVYALLYHEFKLLIFNG